MPGDFPLAVMLPKMGIAVLAPPSGGKNPEQDDQTEGDQGSDPVEAGFSGSGQCKCQHLLVPFHMGGGRVPEEREGLRGPGGLSGALG